MYFRKSEQKLRLNSLLCISENHFFEDVLKLVMIPGGNHNGVQAVFVLIQRPLDLIEGWLQYLGNLAVVALSQRRLDQCPQYLAAASSYIVW